MLILNVFVPEMKTQGSSAFYDTGTNYRSVELSGGLSELVRSVGARTLRVVAEERYNENIVHGEVSRKDLGGKEKHLCES